MMKTLFSVVSLLLIASACSSSNDTNIAQSNPNETGGDQGDSGGGPTGGKTGSGGNGGGRVNAGGAGGSNGVGAGGTGGISRGGAGGASACCFDGCDGRCVPASTRACATIPDHPGNWEQDCRCDGSGWQHVRSPTNTGGTCPVLDAGPYVDAAGAGGAHSDAGRADAGQYCVFESPGAGGAPPSTHCLPLPPGCASCACVTLPYSFCTCTDTAGVVSVRCLGV